MPLPTAEMDIYTEERSIKERKKSKKKNEIEPKEKKRKNRKTKENEEKGGSHLEGRKERWPARIRSLTLISLFFFFFFSCYHFPFSPIQLAFSLRVLTYRRIEETREAMHHSA